MKRLLFILTIALSLVSLSSFANDTKVAAVVLESFKSSFKNATEVDWTVTSNYSKATFVLSGQYISAYYDGTGKQIALTRNISSMQLPMILQSDLKNCYENCWISDLFEIADEQGTSYYATVENADTKVILKSSGSGWSIFQKIRKS